MTNLGIMPIPIFIPSGGHSAPMTEHEGNVIISIWIILNILWVISLLISLIRWLPTRNKSYYARHDRWDIDGLGIFLVPLDLIMLFTWACILLIKAGDRKSVV